MTMAARSAAASVSRLPIHCQNPRLVAVSLTWMTLIRSTARPICRVMRMSMVIQTISSEHAVTASDFTGLRNENIQRSNWKVVFSAKEDSAATCSGPASGDSPSFPASLEAGAVLCAADEIDAVDGVVDAACHLARKPLTTS